MNSHETAPWIGITTYAANENVEVTLPTNYIDAVRRAGGIPVLLPPGETRVAAYLQRLDGVVLAGGGDICPSCYGGELHETVYMVSRERDELELSLAKELLERDIPTLAICRGVQIVNVLLGGSLHPHLPDVVGESTLHRAPPRLPIEHAVTVDAQSLTAHTMQANEVQTMSWHHQAIDRLGDGLKVTARAPDGVIEGVELAAHRWLIGTQWHPEITADRDITQQRLFDALVAASISPTSLSKG